MQNKLYRTKIYDDSKIEIVMHPFQEHNKRSFVLLSKSKSSPCLPNAYMCKRDYVRSLKASYNKLYKRSYPKSKDYRFVTLTSNYDIDFEELKKEFHKFCVYVTRKFGEYEYVKAIEFQSRSHRVHIHIIFQFEKADKMFNKKAIEKLWGLGFCHIRASTDVIGDIQYITKFKKSNMKNDNLTWFPKGAKIISTSQNFGEIIEAEPKKIVLSYNQIGYIIKTLQSLNNGEMGRFLKVDGHYFYNIKKYALDYCLDKIYIRMSKEQLKNILITPLQDQ